MAEDLCSLLDERLSPESLDLLRTAARVASTLGHAVYLVGGSVRDLLLGLPTHDLDLVVEGDGPKLATMLAEAAQGRVSARSPFGTAQVRVGSLSVDVATARKERYPHAGALPVVTNAGLSEDLLRRDFTVHAMACALGDASWGALIDPSGGRTDLEGRQLRVLHEHSFVDDPTRMVRAIRYGARLRFSLEAETERLLVRDRPGLALITGQRRWKELQRVLQEDQPERALLWCDRLGLLQAIHPALTADAFVAGAFIKARQEEVDGDQVPVSLYFSLLVARLAADDLLRVVRELHLPASVAKPARDLAHLQQLADELNRPTVTPSGVVRLLEGYSTYAIRALALLSEEPVLRKRLASYNAEWSDIRPLLPAERLIELGVPPGPAVGQCLACLRAARLDGQTHSVEEEMELVRAWTDLSSTPVP
jgi:tRNA nucleotidyltransferase (CCA-adding enzyme)